MVKWRGQARKDFSGDPLHRWLAWLDPESPPETIEEVKSMDIAIAHADGRQKAVMRGRRAREAYEARQKADMDRRSEIAFAVEAAVAGKDAEIAEWRGAVADKDAALVSKDAVIADRDATLADKDAEIERLRAELRARAGG